MTDPKPLAAPLIQPIYGSCDSQQEGSSLHLECKECVNWKPYIPPPVEVAAPLPEPTKDGRFMCVHCDNRIYFSDRVWRHHGSNLIACFCGKDTNATPYLSVAPLPDIASEPVVKDYLTTAAPAPLGEPAMPMTIGNWTMDEWKAAEARVFAMRVLYNPDALSAIYKDIAINLQAELDRMNAALTSKAVPLGEGELPSLADLPAKERIERTVKCAVCGWYTPGVPQAELHTTLRELLAMKHTVANLAGKLAKACYDNQRLEAELSRLRSQEGPEDAWKRGFWSGLVAASVDIEDEDEDHLQEQVLAIRGNILALRIRPYTPPTT